MKGNRGDGGRGRTKEVRKGERREGGKEEIRKTNTKVVPVSDYERCCGEADEVIKSVVCRKGMNLRLRGVRGVMCCGGLLYLLYWVSVASNALSAEIV